MGIGLVWLLAGCTSPGSPTMEARLSTPTMLFTQVSVTPTSASSASLQPTQSPTQLPTETPTPAAVEQAGSDFQICSPLEWETIPELWEIISDPYAPPPPGRDERHQGVDFSHWSRKGHKTIQGEPVQSVLAGRVAGVTIDRLPFGNLVIIESPYSDLPGELTQSLEMKATESLYLLYAHFDEPPLVSLEQQVDCGQVIGAVGIKGYNVVNAHLHLETRKGPAGVTFGPMAFYTTAATEAEMATYQRWRTSGEFAHFDPMRLFEFALESQKKP